MSKNMSAETPYCVTRSAYYGTYFSTAEEAIAHAKRGVVSNNETYGVYKLQSLVTAPEFAEKDVKVEKVA